MTSNKNPDKKGNKVKHPFRIHRSTLTISLPDKVKEWVRKKENYSAFIASLLKAEIAKEQQMKGEAPAVSAEEKEIRKALKERERLSALYGDLIYDVEYAIRKGYDPDKEMVIVEDWRKYLETKDINDRYDYFPVYAKYCGELVSGKHHVFWREVKERFEKDAEEQRAKDMEKEVTGGLTKREILDKVEIYRKRQFDAKMKHYKEEHDKAIEGTNDASGYMKAGTISRSMATLQEEFEAKGVTMKDVLAALGLPYGAVYNKVLAILRREGYKIIT